ncbi:hypothetical protein Ciccas_004521 [Cichlidogyrus casuarinus]|uniref:Uncharacterized protein n=1 Tax=Cichlidogyrus casuarinus TaxID=1844966 RepID=A0ABD2QBD0_9PLAT
MLKVLQKAQTPIGFLDVTSLNEALLNWRILAPSFEVIFKIRGLTNEKVIQSLNEQLRFDDIAACLKNGVKLAIFESSADLDTIAFVTDLHQYSRSDIGLLLQVGSGVDLMSVYSSLCEHTFKVSNLVNDDPKPRIDDALELKDTTLLPFMFDASSLQWQPLQRKLGSRLFTDAFLGPAGESLHFLNGLKVIKLQAPTDKWLFWRLSSEECCVNWRNSLAFCIHSRWSEFLYIP